MSELRTCPDCGHGQFYRGCDVRAGLEAVVDGSGRFLDFVGDLEDQLSESNIEAWDDDSRGGWECAACGRILAVADDDDDGGE